MEIKNTMEGIVLHNINEVLKKYPEACKCDKCCRDIVISTLNRLPPKYAATAKGDTFINVSLYNQAGNTAIIREIAKSIELVMKNPHHEQE